MEDGVVMTNFAFDVAWHETIHHPIAAMIGAVVALTIEIICHLLITGAKKLRLVG